MIAILEDDPGRTAAMKDALRDGIPFVEAIVFDNAPDMVAWLAQHLSSVRLLSLDHDLGPNRERDGRAFDPGIGRDVVDALATNAAACAVIVHSANVDGAQRMVFALQDAGWSAERVIPAEDLAWVKTRWIARVVALMTADREAQC